MNTAPFVFITVILIAATAWLISTLIPPTPDDGAMRLDLFARLPVVHEGRLKPIDTVARSTLMVLTDKSSFDRPEDDPNSEPITSIQWLLDVMSSGIPPPAVSPADLHQVFRIESHPILNHLNLPHRKGFRYAWAELAPHIDEIRRQAVAANDFPSDQRTLFQKKILELFMQMRRHYDLAQWIDPLIVPPTQPGLDWQSLDQAIAHGDHSGRHDRLAEALDFLLRAYRANDTEAFNTVLAEYHQVLETHMPGAIRRTDRELAFSRAAPFYNCMILYIGALLLACLSWMFWHRTMTRAALALLLLTLLAHTIALIFRMVIEGRPPVTNLYASAVFVGWAGVVLAAVLEFISRRGIATFVGSIIGFASLLIAHHLSDGDDFKALVAVLDTNFWLATHVVCITIGYSATFVAGLMGLLFILRGAIQPEWLDADMRRHLATLTYGTICFATLFSFTGTVLGGIWADQSWGRFWGWDPKENGALIIVIWTALVLHAYWGRLVKERGLAVLAVFGNVVTAWSWFGVNMLGAGLHSYGFMDSMLLYFWGFIALQMFIMSIGLLPMRVWTPDPPYDRPNAPAPPS